MIACRFLYRLVKSRHWRVLSVSIMRDKEAASALCEEWQRRDNGKHEWDFEECYPTDYDYPKQERKENS